MCAVGAIIRFDGKDASSDLRRIMHRLQNRGQEQKGIVSFQGEGKPFCCHKAEGFVKAAYLEHHLEHLKGSIAIGHNRYSTAGASNITNAQPHLCKIRHWH